MPWNKQRIDSVALRSAASDYDAFETIGLDALENGRVLDVGCFDGYNTVLKFKPYGNLDAIVGIDPDQEALEQARAQTDDPRFTWAHANAEDYDAADESFDLVYLSHSFQHVRDKEKTVRNAFRLLKPGGSIVIKATDDSCKLSYPDPDHVMKRLFALYEAEIIHKVPHTSSTDRNVGQKLFTYLTNAGFACVQIKVDTTDTADKSREEREELFDRFTYFRRKTPAGVSREIGDEQHELLERWKELFMHEDYYHLSNTFVATARKPGRDGMSNEELPKPSEEELLLSSPEDMVLAPMQESDLGETMAIEIDSYPDPWTPLAYAMELRHNPRAQYLVARDTKGTMLGNVGWWINGDGTATIMHIAVSPASRRLGVGSALLGCACANAARSKCSAMTLSVRAQNSPARAFYKHQGFSEVQVYEKYYTAPTDDAVFMVKQLV